MTRQERIEKQEFLLGARPGVFEGLILCPRCNGYGHEDVDLPEDVGQPCKQCGGQKVVLRRVTVVVEDSSVDGEGWPEFRPVQELHCTVCHKAIPPGTLAIETENGEVRHFECVKD